MSQADQDAFFSKLQEECRLFNFWGRPPQINILDISATTTGKIISFKMKQYTEEERKCIVEVARKLNKKVDQKNGLLRVILPM
jgi:uncharacterized protein involved in propanediol utilization